MPDVPKHAWTHRPRAQGGTDPIETASSDLTWAMASASTTAVADSGLYYELGFDFLYSNDSTGGFEAANVTAGRARFMQINTPGYYVMRARIFKASGVWDNTNDTWIEPTFDVAGVLQAIQPNLDVEDFIGSYWAAPSKVKVSGTAWESLYTELAFNWDPATGGTDFKNQNPLKVGLTLALASGPATISMAGDLHVMRMAAPGYVDLSP